MYMTEDQPLVDTSVIEDRLKNSFMAVKKDMDIIDKKQEALKSDLHDEIDSSYKSLKEDVKITEKEIRFILSRLSNLEKSIEKKDRKISELEKRLEKKDNLKNVNLKKNHEIIKKVNEVVEVVNTLIDTEDDFEISVNRKISEIIYYLDALKKLGDKISYMENRIDNLKFTNSTEVIESIPQQFITKEEFENTISNIKSNLSEIGTTSKKKKLEKVKKVFVEFFTEEIDEDNNSVVPIPK
jgi:chromosome segregation ATPase